MQHPFGAAVVAAAIVLIAVPPCAAHAQRAEGLPVGVRLRVELRAPPRASITGLLVRADSVALTLAAPDSTRLRTVPRSEIVRLARYAGRRSAGAAFGRGAGRGALVGVVLSGVLLAIASIEDRRHPCGECFIDARVAAGVVAVPFTVASTLVGGLTGLHDRDRWTPFALP